MYPYTPNSNSESYICYCIKHSHITLSTLTNSVRRYHHTTRHQAVKLTWQMCVSMRLTVSVVILWLILIYLKQGINSIKPYLGSQIEWIVFLIPYDFAELDKLCMQLRDLHSVNSSFDTSKNQLFQPFKLQHSGEKGLKIFFSKCYCPKTNGNVKRTLLLT